MMFDNTKKRKILWIGPRLSESRLRFLKASSATFLSGYVASSGYINAFNEIGVAFDSISFLVFPRSIEKKVRRQVSFEGGSEIVEIGYPNIPYLGNIARNANMKKEARIWANKNKDQNPIVFVYEVTTPRLSAALEVKRMIPSAHLCLIVPDLPMYMEFRTSLLKKIAKFWDRKLIESKIQKMDSYVLYTKPMAKKLKIENKRWMVMEGFYEAHQDSVVKTPLRTTSKTAVMYSGLLEKGFGLDKLIQSLDYLDNNVELWFTGTGNYEKDLEKIAETDCRVKVFGFLQDRDDLYALQRSASALITLRDPSHRSSNFCFPSKIMEYLASGKPVISNRINGIPDEYYQYLIAIDSIEPKEIASAIERVSKFSEEDVLSIGKKANDFVCKNKNNKKQVAKILDMIGNDSAGGFY